MKRTILATLVLAAAPLLGGQRAADMTRMTLRDEFLRLINRDRVQAGLQPVQLDRFATAVADNYCVEQIRNGTSGHFTTDGEAPYMRYSFAGGNDAVSENAAAWSANTPFDDRELLDMVRRSERAMMLERAPDDGHRRTILDPYATRVGIGLAWQGGEFRLTQEFVRHYIDWKRALPRAASVSDAVLCSGRPLPGWDIEAITVHHEPLPQPMLASAANDITSYSLPANRHVYRPRLPTRFTQTANGTIEEVRVTYSDGRRGDFPISANGSFAFVIPFSEGPGVYTVVVWVRPHGGQEPIAATDVSIRVSDARDSVTESAASR